MAHERGSPAKGCQSLNLYLRGHICLGERLKTTLLQLRWLRPVSTSTGAFVPKRDEKGKTANWGVALPG